MSTGARLERAGETASRLISLRPADPNVRRGLYAAITLVVLLSVALAILAAVSDLPNLDWDLQGGWLALGVLGFGAFTIYSAELWRRILLALGPRLPARRGAAVWCASALGRYVPTSLLLPVIRVAMAERDGVRKGTCLASIAYELILTVTGSALVGAYLIIDLPELQAEPARFAALVIPLLAFAALHPSIFRRVADFTLGRLGRPQLEQILSFREAVTFAALYMVDFVIAGVSVYALAHLAYPIDSGDLPIIIGGFAASNVLSLLAFLLPSGIVAREAALVLALSPIMPSVPALAVAVLVRIVQLAVELVLAALTSLLDRNVRVFADTTILR